MYGLASASLRRWSLCLLAANWAALNTSPRSFLILVMHYLSMGIHASILLARARYSAKRSAVSGTKSSGVRPHSA